MRRFWVVVAMLGAALAARGQWVLQNSGTTASFRGVHYVGDGVAWVSGTGGTILRTVDMGKTWVKCAVPEGAEKLDFRGVQAFDAKTAIVMSSGPGDASRLYKTMDGCGTWKLVFTNPDKEGFWDAIQFVDAEEGYLIGDPVSDEWVAFHTEDGGLSWIRQKRVKVGLPGIDSKPQALFAASNSTLQFPTKEHHPVPFVAAGGSIFVGIRACETKQIKAAPDECASSLAWQEHPVAVIEHGKSSGLFSLALRLRGSRLYAVAVGGDYEKPDSTRDVASYFTFGDKRFADWSPSEVHPPGGYRSAVEYSKQLKAWVTVGPNGTDVSFDDGQNWRALKPGPGDAAEADKGWNALSLPFVVGEHGRIGVLRDGVLK